LRRRLELRKEVEIRSFPGEPVQVHRKSGGGELKSETAEHQQTARFQDRNQRLRKRLVQDVHQDGGAEVGTERLHENEAGDLLQTGQQFLTAFGQQEYEHAKLHAAHELARRRHLPFAACLEQPPRGCFFCLFAGMGHGEGARRSNP